MNEQLDLFKKGLDSGSENVKSPSDRTEYKGNIEIGERFGKLVVIGFAEPTFTKSGRKIKRCECLCDCGNKVIVDNWHLKGGATVSCKCYRKQRQIETNIKHGYRRTRLYYIWCGMKQRAGNPNNRLYANVSICDEWKDFISFKDWSLANGYRDDLTIDRVDNNKGYEPSNCRWTTFKVQANNTSRNHYITIDGITHTLSEWVDIYDTEYQMVKDRIYSGWNPLDALTMPKGSRNPIKKKYGERK